jgi:hypothetical protein
VFDDAPGCRDPLPSVRRESDWFAIASDCGDLLERQRISVDDNFIGHLGNVSRAL